MVACCGWLLSMDGYQRRELHRRELQRLEPMLPFFPSAERGKRVYLVGLSPPFFEGARRGESSFSSKASFEFNFWKASFGLAFDIY